MAAESTIDSNGDLTNEYRSGITRLRRWQVRAAVIAVTALGVCVGTAYGIWYLPFIAGFAVGILIFPARLGWLQGLAVVATLGVLPWSVVLIARSLDGQLVIGAAHAAAGLAGIPPVAALTIAAALGISAAQVALGRWLATALRRVVSRHPAAMPGMPRRPRPAPDPVRPAKERSSKGDDDVR